MPFSGKAYVRGLTHEFKYLGCWTLVNIGMSWGLAVVSIGKYGEEVGGLGGLEVGGTRAEHWPKGKWYSPRQNTSFDI